MGNRSQNIQKLQSGIKQARAFNSQRGINLAGGAGSKAYGPPLPKYQRAVGINNSGGVGTQPYGPNVPEDEKNITKGTNRNLRRIAFDLANITRGSKDELQRVPIPGGIWFPLSILLALMFVLIPVNGHTRIVWFFLSLAGLAHIEGANMQISGPGGIQGAGTQFGGGTGGGDVQPFTPGQVTRQGQAYIQQGFDPNVVSSTTSSSNPGTKEYQSNYEPYRPYDEI